MSGLEHPSLMKIEPIEEVRVKLEELKKKHGFVEPNRGDLDDPSIEWRYEKPDYARANYEYLKGKTQNHARGLFRFLKSYLHQDFICGIFVLLFVVNLT